MIKLCKYSLVFIVGFAIGYFVKLQLQKSSVAFTVLSPDDCKQFGLKDTGWHFQAIYKGGINQGGASSFITYECK